MNPLDKFDIVIRKRNGRITAGIPQVGLYAKGNDVATAISALESKKQAFVADLEEAGELEILDIAQQPLATARSLAIRPAGGIGQFAIKTAIVAVAVIFIFVTSGLLLASRVNQTIADVKSIKIGGSQFWTHVETEIDRMARPDSALSEAKKQKLLADIRAISAKWRPFLIEIQNDFATSGKPEQPPSTAASK